ncbi:uncharacterized protein HGUI_01438 [Hanseniaspora guilliermondii]|uniref:Uncharacterized protein n=1 Tax=Hanseniaspora guilliermondii TaxID=56406 RepID=A0A1L0FI10_9ASCO|nr:uncharacterized protein HGUI_01438 [Hanseniaspora guilliermondii]
MEANSGVLKYDNSSKQFSIGTSEYVKDVFEINHIANSFSNMKGASLDELNFKSYTKTQEIIKNKSLKIRQQITEILQKSLMNPENRKTNLPQIESLVKECQQMIEEKITGDISGYALYTFPFDMELDEEKQCNGAINSKNLNDGNRNGVSMLENPFQVTMEELELAYMTYITCMNAKLRLKYENVEKQVIPEKNQTVIKTTFEKTKEAESEIKILLETLNLVKELGMRTITALEHAFMETDLLFKLGSIKEAKNKLEDVKPEFITLTNSLVQMGLINVQEKKIAVEKLDQLTKQHISSKLPGKSPKDKLVLWQNFNATLERIQKASEKEFGL